MATATSPVLDAPLPRRRSSSAGATLLLAFALGFPSLKIQRYGGMWAVAAYVPFLAVGLWFVRRVAGPLVMRRVTERQAWILGAATILLVATAYVVLYPLATSGRLGGGNGGGGSDRDEALNIGVHELLAGRYPYYARTFVPGLPHARGLDNNPLSPMPGELLFAAPFVLLGNGAHQTIFWLALFFAGAALHLRDARSALLLLWTMLGLAPTVLHEIVTGGDLLAIALWTVLLSLWLLRTARPAGPMRQAIAAALLLGVGLSSRPTFLLIVPVGAAALVWRAGAGRGASLAALVVLAFAGVTLPFYFHDPAGFTPLYAFEKVARFDRTLPHAGAWATMLAVAAAVGLAVRRRQRGDCDPAMADIEAFLRRACAALAVPVVATVLLSSFDRQALEFADFAWYGLAFLPFGALGAWSAFLGDTPAP